MEVKNESINNAAINVGEDVTKFLLGHATSLGAGALTAAAISMIPNDTVKGFGKLFTWIGGIGIGLAVSEAASTEMEKKVGDVFTIIRIACNAEEFFAKVDEYLRNLQNSFKEEPAEEDTVDDGNYKEV